jgi:hypothetical protein
MFGCFLEHLKNLWHVKSCKTHVSRLNAIFWCSEVPKNSFTPNASILLHWTEIMFGCLLEHLEILWHVKRCKTCNLGMNALPWCTEVAKMAKNQMLPFYSIGPKMMFDCLLKQRKPSVRKKMQNLCFGP